MPPSSPINSSACDRYGRSMSSARVASQLSNTRPTPYARPRGLSSSTTNTSHGSPSSIGNTGSSSSPPAPPSAPQTPTSQAPNPTSSPFASSYSQSSFMPVEPSSTTVFSYPSSWQSNSNYWSSAATSMGPVPGPMAVNVGSSSNRALGK